MKSLMTFMGIAAFNFVSLAHASDFSCPVSGSIAASTCSGTVKVETLDQLNAYKNSLGVVAKKPTVAKNLLINFNPALTADLAISTPYTIKIAKDVVNTTMGLIFFNTEERVRNSIQMDELVGGFLSEPISEGLDYAQFCSRI